MKKLHIALIATAAIGGLSVSLWAAMPAKTTDVVRDVPAMSDEFSEEGRLIGAHLATLPPAEHADYLAKTWPDLEKKVLADLRLGNRLPDGAIVEKVEFAFSSGRSPKGNLIQVSAEQRNGPPVLGTFTNQLVALVSVKGEDEPRRFFVECLNGLLTPVEELALLTTYQPLQPFTIETGRGIAFYTKDYVLAIRIAEACAFPLYREETRGRRLPITPERARATDTDETQVTVGVLTGDYIDPQNLTCRKVDGRR